MLINSAVVLVYFTNALKRLRFSPSSISNCNVLTIISHKNRVQEKLALLHVPLHCVYSMNMDSMHMRWPTLLFLDGCASLK